ncbi:hypothetical protein LTR04_004435, partial [Oleoguttula sp. CCFEE 6159]
MRNACTINAKIVLTFSAEDRSMDMGAPESYDQSAQNDAYHLRATRSMSVEWRQKAPST